MLTTQNRILLENQGTSMWFWSVSWPTNCSVNFSFFGVGQKDWPILETGHFFVYSLDFLSTLDIREWTIFKKGWKKNSRDWTKKCPVSEIGQFSFGGSKNEKLTGQLVSQRDWPKPHGRHFCVVLIRINFAKNQILTKEAGGDEENTTHFIGSPFPIYCPLPIPHYCHGD